MIKKEAFSGKSSARGRNGWFALAHGDSHYDERDKRLFVNLFSKRMGEVAPIVLMLDDEDREALIRLLQAGGVAMVADPAGGPATWAVLDDDGSVLDRYATQEEAVFMSGRGE